MHQRDPRAHLLQLLQQLLHLRLRHRIRAQRLHRVLVQPSYRAQRFQRLDALLRAHRHLPRRQQIIRRLTHRRQHEHRHLLRKRQHDLRDLSHARRVGDGRTAKLHDDRVLMKPSTGRFIRRVRRDRRARRARARAATDATDRASIERARGRARGRGDARRHARDGL